MIVTSKLTASYESLPKSSKACYSCDYCGKEFEREIKTRERGLEKCPKDSCGEKGCKNKKKAEGYLIRFGVTHNSQLKDVKEKKIVKIKAKMPETLQKMKKTNLEKYGAEFASQTDAVKEKMKQTCLSTYGTVSSLLNEDVREKTKATNLSLYGVEFPMQSEVIKAKREETNLEKFGVPHASQSEEVKNKIIESNLARYGVPYSGMADEVKEKIIQTNLERYGVENPLENEEINDKRKNTNLERYGTAHTGQVEEFKQKGIQTSIERYGVEYAIQSRKILEKMIQSNLQKYGVISPSMLDEIKEKVKKTCLERFGFEHAAQSEEVKEKIKTSMIENHGVESALQNPNIKSKQINSMLEKHGHEHALQVPEFKDKAQKTLIQNYGVDSPLKSEEIKEKYKNTSQNKYGTDHPLSSDEVRQKIEETNLEKYGHANPLQNEDVKNNMKNNNLEKYGVEYTSQIPAVIEKIKSTNIEKYGVPCVLLLPENRKYGKTQEEIKEYINSFGFEFKSNYIILDGKEIDLYDDNIKIGFEYCGLYWHNELSPEPRTRKYHWDKYTKCATKEVRLITIFEDEWIKRNSQCKNFIKSILNKNSIKIFARKCEIKPIEKIEFQAFCDAYHIQGANKLAVICYGLFHNGEMIGGISLGKHHRHGQELILDRLCFKDDISVIGGSSKLFKACILWAKENGFSTIGSWSDNRWSAGGVYKKLGFDLIDDGKPDYSYVDITKKCKRRSKQSQRKPKGELRTEREICLEKGLVRIWDCGKKKWVFKIT